MAEPGPEGWQAPPGRRRGVNHSQEAHGGRGGAQEGGSGSGKAESKLGGEELPLERVCEGGDWNKVCRRAWQGMPAPTLQDSSGIKTGKTALQRESWWHRDVEVVRWSRS